MILKELAEFKNIAIQCHNIPDADTICSGYALQCFLHSLGAQAKLVFGGPQKITKPSLLLLVEMFKIEIEHVAELPPETDLLITVDCQRGAGNVQNFDLPENAKVAVIDHHRPEIEEGESVVIRPHLGSCATLVWDMLRKEGYDMDLRLQNALFYGLYTDTNGLSELRHPLDRDLAELPSDAGMIRKLKNSAITLEELDIVGSILKNYEIKQNIGLFRAVPCDANLLGFASDIAKQVAGLDCCVVYCELQSGIKLSIRSSVREIMASEIAAFLCRDVGSGGGNTEKAGGFLSFSSINELPDSLASKLQKNEQDSLPVAYLKLRISDYLDNYDLIYADNNNIDFAAMPLYKKLPTPVGYAASTDIFPDGTKITIRTLEGDIDTVTKENIYLMIGILGEVYPIMRSRFEVAYNATDEPYRQQTEYQPILLDRVTGERREVVPFAKKCVPKGTKLVRARILEKDTKVFSYWDTDKYFFGSKGDYLVANEGKYDDCYIVRGDIFGDSYCACKD